MVNILRPVAGIKFEMSSFCAYNCKIAQFKHLLCYLSFIVNKILAHVIWKSFYSNVKKRANISGIRVVFYLSQWHKNVFYARDTEKQAERSQDFCVVHVYIEKNKEKNYLIQRKLSFRPR